MIGTGGVPIPESNKPVPLRTTRAQRHSSSADERRHANSTIEVAGLASPQRPVASTGRSVVVNRPAIVGAEHNQPIVPVASVCHCVHNLPDVLIELRDHACVTAAAPVRPVCMDRYALQTLPGQLNNERAACTTESDTRRPYTRKARAGSDCGCTSNGDSN
jgi:hypothetical protein